jgi:hypothetical protein
MTLKSPDNLIKFGILDSSLDKIKDFSCVNCQGSVYYLKTEVLTGGGFVLTWSLQTKLYFSIYNDEGQVIADQKIVLDIPGSYYFNHSVASLSSGGFVLVWTNDPNILGKIYDSIVNSVVSTFTVFTGTIYDAKNSVVGFSDGGFTVGYSKNDAGDIYGRDYDATATATAIGNEYLIVSYTNDKEYLPVIIKTSFEKWMILYLKSTSYTLRLDKESNFKPFRKDFTQEINDVKKINFDQNIGSPVSEETDIKVIIKSLSSAGSVKNAASEILVINTAYSNSDIFYNPRYALEDTITYVSTDSRNRQSSECTAKLTKKCYISCKSCSVEGASDDH